MEKNSNIFQSMALICIYHWRICIFNNKIVRVSYENTSWDLIRECFRALRWLRFATQGSKTLRDKVSRCALDLTKTSPRMYVLSLDLGLEANYIFTLFVYVDFYSVVYSLSKKCVKWGIWVIVSRDQLHIVSRTLLPLQSTDTDRPIFNCRQSQVAWCTPANRPKEAMHFRSKILLILSFVDF